MARDRTASDAELASGFGGCLATASRVIDRAVAAAFDERLRPIGLRSTQVTLLATIAGAEPPVRAADLVGPLRIDQTTISRNLGRLSDLGLVDQSPGDDGRAADLRLTPLGRRRLRQALPLWRGAQAEIADQLGGRGADALRKAASRLAE